MLAEINDLCRKNNEELSSVIARCCCFDRGEIVESSKGIIKDVFRKVENELGLEKAFGSLIPLELWNKKLSRMTVPDWQLLLLKLEVPISDDGWQKLLNRTHLGKNGQSSVAPVLLSKNSIKACKGLVFSKVEDLYNIKSIEDDSIPGYYVGLEPVICWQTRELHLHGHTENHLQFNLKLDGRPFASRSQVLVGVIPSKTINHSSHSCKSFCPLAIANCKENRESLTKLITNLNQEKDMLKRNGIQIDGQKYTVSFKVTLDLEALYLLLVKDDDCHFQLGGKGLNVEFCFFCHALRVRIAVVTWVPILCAWNTSAKIKQTSAEVYKKILEYQQMWEDRLGKMKNKLSDLSVVLESVGTNRKQSKKRGTKKIKKAAAIKTDSLSSYAADITYDFFLEVFTGWRDIALVMREDVFSKDEELDLIDFYDLQCKEWGFLLRENFGNLLGTGDYGHMTIEHTSMLLRAFGSIREYSNQSIEAAHSLHRQLYSKASSHDRHGYTSSSKLFHFVGCGWTVAAAKSIVWSPADLQWIEEMDCLMTRIFGADTLVYETDKLTKITEVSAISFPEFTYSHKEWEENRIKASSSPHTASTTLDDSKCGPNHQDQEVHPTVEPSWQRYFKLYMNYQVNKDSLIKANGTFLFHFNDLECQANHVEVVAVAWG
ncbi:hypothetical protein QZH41_012621 [Actinostola sp. cb2023]|nr:hypothetical protein QZH41_012621 [Actinostola sp. cb2023]